jgi:hypothetical protein
LKEFYWKICFLLGNVSFSTLLIYLGHKMRYIFNRFDLGWKNMTKIREKY